MLLLRKGVYPYEYLDDWDRFNEEKLSSKICLIFLLSFPSLISLFKPLVKSLILKYQ